MKRFLLLLGLLGLVFTSCDTEVPALTSIDVRILNNRYNIGDKISPEDIEVMARYNNMTEKIVAGYTVRHEPLTEVGDVTVAVEYTEGGITKTCAYGVHVRGLYDLLVSHNSGGSIRMLNSSWDEDAAACYRVEARYYPMNTSDDYKTLKYGEYDVTPSEFNTLGPVTLTFTYSDGGITKTYSFVVEVVKPITISYFSKTNTLLWEERGFQGHEYKVSNHALDGHELLGWAESFYGAIIYAPDQVITLGSEKLDLYGVWAFAKKEYPEYIEFGEFPQTIKHKNITVNESCTRTAGAYTYCKGNDGEWYCKVKENASGSFFKYSNGEPVKRIADNSYRWFKVEPIKWKVLTTNYNSSGKRLLFAQKGLIAGIPYYHTTAKRVIARGKVTTEIYANSYSSSEIRAYLTGAPYPYGNNDTAYTYALNGGFLGTAFTSASAQLIATTTVDNSVRSTCPDVIPITWPATNSYANGGTSPDKIFLLSLQEITTSAYGFATAIETGESMSGRCRQPTDFALANYGNFDSDLGASSYWLRSPSPDTDAPKSYYVSGFGSTGLSDIANSANKLIVPALCID